MHNETSTEPFSNSPGEPPPPAQQGIWIVVYYSDGVEAARLAPGQSLVVGRGEPSTLCVPDRTLSRTHARFSLIDGRVLVEDLGSRNGTWLAGKKIERAEIEIGGEVSLGTVIARIVALGVVGDPAVDSDESFRRRLDEEIVRARHFRRPFALLAVCTSKQDAVRSPTGAWVANFRASIGPVARVSLSTPAAALILLPEMGAEAASKVAHSITSVRGIADVPYFVGMAVYPEVASTAEELVAGARAAARRATAASPVVPALMAGDEKNDIARGDGGAVIVNAAMQKLRAKAARVASARLPLTLRGETGTGKEVLARFIHEHSPRRDKHMVSINCGVIPKDLVEATLFGHEKGAFTGASNGQRGVFEEAHEGTLFLDEIGDLPLATQVALLRVLEDGTFSRVGSPRVLKVDVRVIAATHKDLERMVRESEFREDLYHRLCGMKLTIPPLRERLDEIEPLVMCFIEEANRANRASEQSVRGITKEAMDLLRAHAWPGNVRELRNVVEWAVVLASGELIQPEDLTIEGVVEPEALQGKMKAEVEDVEKREMIAALQSVGWNREKAAKQLGMSLSALARRIRKYKLEPPKP